MWNITWVRDGMVAINALIRSATSRRPGTGSPSS
jgi:GH15 family glucan-1,4-alpha-glucosidase